MDSIDQLLSTMVIEDILEMVKNYEVLREKGSLGDCLLREVTEEYVKKHNITLGAALMMDRFGLESYRYMARVFMGIT